MAGIKLDFIGKAESFGEGFARVMAHVGALNGRSSITATVRHMGLGRNIIPALSPKVSIEHMNVTSIACAILGRFRGVTTGVADRNSFSCGLITPRVPAAASMSSQLNPITNLDEVAAFVGRHLVFLNHPRDTRLFVRGHSIFPTNFASVPLLW